MRSLTLALLCAASFIAAPAVHAQAFQHVSVAARVGTLGPGLELTASITPKLNLRLAGHYLGYSRTDRITNYEIEVQSDADLRLASGALFADYFPFGSTFRATAGLVLNQNELTVLAKPLEDYILNGRPVTPARLGTISGTLGYDLAVSPYLGIGFGNPVRPEARLGFLFDLGVLYTGSPTVDLEGTGMVAPTAEQAPQIEDDFKDFRFYPLLSLGLSYKL